MNNLKILILFSCFFYFSSYSQNKKEQIEMLTKSFDSLKIVNLNNLTQLVEQTTINTNLKLIIENLNLKNDIVNKENDQLKKHNLELSRKLDESQKQNILFRDSIARISNFVKMQNKKIDSLLVLLNPKATFIINSGRYEAFFNNGGTLEIGINVIAENLIEFNYNAICKKGGYEFASTGKANAKFETDCNCFRSEKFEDESSKMPIKLNFYSKDNQLFIVFLPTSNVSEKSDYCWDLKEKLDLKKL
jgi:hypothetical protein